MMKKSFISFWIVVLVISMALCFRFKQNILDPIISQDDLLNYRLNIIDASFKIEGVENSADIKYTEYENMKQDSELVILAKINGDRKIRENTILTPVTVLEVYKGDIQYADKIVNVFEPVTYLTDLQLECNKNYKIMSEDKEYILFLDERQFVEGAKHKDNNTFILTDELLGKYGKREKIQIFNEDMYSGLKYEQIKDYAIVTQNNAILNLYNKFADLVFTEYN